MNTNFVVHQDDLNSEIVTQELESLSLPYRIIQNGEKAKAGEIALASFTGTPTEAASIRGSACWIAQGAHKFNGHVPQWAHETAFVGLILNTEPKVVKGGRRVSKLGYALKSMYQNHVAWVPNGKDSKPPWGLLPTGEERIAQYEDWYRKAINQIDVTTSNILNALDVDVLYGQSKADGWVSPMQIVWMGCMHLNMTRTDIVDALDTERIVPGLAEIIETLKDKGLVRSITFALADERMIENPILKASLNPLLWADLTRAVHFDPSIAYRKSGNLARVEDEELISMLRKNAEITIRDIINPLIRATGIEVKITSWYELLVQYLDYAQEVADHHMYLLDKIYAERSKTYFSYQRMDSMLGSKTGKERAYANMIIYLSTAMWARDNAAEGIIADYEHDSQWMTELAPALNKVWDEAPLYLHFPRRLCQPWS